MKQYVPLKNTAKMNGIMKWHFLEARFVRLNRPVAWVTSGTPVELLRSMGILPLYPENYGALCGAQRVSPELCSAAESKGYSPDLCSYALNHLGSIFNPGAAPMKGLPRPHLLVACNNVCSTVTEWYEAVAEYFKIPLFFMDTPFIFAGEDEEKICRYVSEEMKALAAKLESFSRRKMDCSRLHQILRCSSETIAAWKAIREMCRTRPSPLNAPDLFVHMAPIVVLRGTRLALNYYRSLYREVQVRAQSGVAAVGDEKYRLLWDNIAIWYGLYRFFNHFAAGGACFVSDTYTGGWSMEINIESKKPLEALARAYAGIFLNQSLEKRVAKMCRMIDEYGVQGIVLHANRSCKPYTLLQYEILRQVKSRTGIPGVIFEADMCNPKYYADEAVQTRIEAFLETLEAKSYS